ncbi:MAG: hypothetical protein ACOYT4_03705 [Nanoarchaeota archaeon]
MSVDFCDKLNFWKEDPKELEFRRNVLEAILVNSNQENEFKFPTIPQFISEGLANAAIDHFSNKHIESPLLYRENDEKFEESLRDHFIQNLNSELKAYFYNVESNFSKILEVVYKLILPMQATGDHEKNYLTCELYEFYKGQNGHGGICNVAYESTFELPKDLIQKVQSEVMPNLDEKEKTDIKKIGKSMRRYIKEDLEFIRQQYSW